MEEVAANAEEAQETTVEAMKEDNATTANGSKSSESVSAVSTRTATTKKKAIVSSNLIKPTASSSLRISSSTPVTIRRNSTGGVTEKSVGATKVLPKQMTSASRNDPVRRSLPELRKSLVSSLPAKTASKASLPESKKSILVSPGSQSSTKSTGSNLSKPDSSAKPAMGVSLSSKRAPSSSVDSSGSRTSSGRTVSKASPPSAKSLPSVSSGIISKSFSTPLDRSSNLSGRKITATPESIHD